MTSGVSVGEICKFGILLFALSLFGIHLLGRAWPVALLDGGEGIRQDLAEDWRDEPFGKLIELFHEIG